MRGSTIVRQVAANSAQQPTTPYSAAHKAYVQSLYRRFLKHELDWCIRRDVWRMRAIEIRTEFERNRHVANPRQLSVVLQQAEETLRGRAHPDPYRPPEAEGGTKWERNIPPRMFTKAEKEAAIAGAEAAAHDYY